MSADEIRKLVRIYSAKEKNLKHELEKFNEAEMTPNLENISIARNDAIMTIHALLDYAAMVERCEKEVEATSCKDCGKYNGCPCADHDDCGLYEWHNRFVKILHGAEGKEEEGSDGK